MATACSSGGNSAGTSNAAGTAPAGGGTAATTVLAHTGSMGSFLTDSAGKSLYMFASDTASKSTCSGICVHYWAPLTARGPVHSSGTVTMSKLSTITRSDGTKQVVYAGHPLYYYSGRHRCRRHQRARPRRLRCAVVAVGALRFADHRLRLVRTVRHVVLVLALVLRWRRQLGLDARPVHADLATARRPAGPLPGASQHAITDWLSSVKPVSPGSAAHVRRGSPSTSSRCTGSRRS